MKEKNWKECYERDCDALFVGVYPMKRGVRMFKLDENVHAYIDRKGEIKGIYIEYYKSDFIKKFRLQCPTT